MATAFIQLYPDSNATGKQLDSDVVQLPAGTVITNLDGTTTVLSAPAYVYRERVVNADPANPVGLAAVTNDSGPYLNDFGLVVRLPPGQDDLQTLAELLSDMRADIRTLAMVVGQAAQSQQMSLPLVGGLQPARATPTIPIPSVCDVFGRQIVLPHTIRELVADQAQTFTTTTENTIITAGDANTFNDVVAIIAVNTSATATRVDIRDQLSTVTSPAGGAVKPLYVPAGDMRGLSLGGVLIKQTNAGQAWTATLGTAVTDIRIWALYIKNRSQ